MKFKNSSKNRGLLFILAALFCGLIAVMIVMSVGSKLAPSVPALEAIQDIKMGTPLDRSMFREIKLAEASVPSQLVDVDINFTGLVAAKDISAGDILREPSILSLEGNPALFSARLRALNDPKLRAVEIPTNSVEGLLSGMGNGDRVDIIAVYEELKTTGEFSASAEDTLVAKTIIEGAPVLGVRTSDSENIEGSEPTMLVVALTQEQAETISLYRELGNIYATLRPFGDKPQENTTEQSKQEHQKPADSANQGLKRLEPSNSVMQAPSDGDNSVEPSSSEKTNQEASDNERKN